MSEQPKFIRWVDTDEGIKTQRIYNDWLKEKLGDGFDISFQKGCELQCDFFNEQLDNLKLSERGQKEVFMIWRASAQYLEDQYIHNLVRHAL
jgi:hypothetical protein